MVLWNREPRLQIVALLDSDKPAYPRSRVETSAELRRVHEVVNQLLVRRLFEIDLRQSLGRVMCLPSARRARDKNAHDHCAECTTSLDARTHEKCLHHET